MKGTSVVAVLVALVVLTSGGLFVALDADGLSITEEVNAGTSPFNSDTDNDGVTDGEEVQRGTSPTNPDTDADGIDDREEIDSGTSATAADTDEDGLEDGEELELGTDPTTADTDGDGLTDGAEVQRYETDPSDSDTDNDNLTDGREIDLGTDPTAKHTDGDRLNDYSEVEVYNTDPTSIDTDSDKLRDDREVSIGTDPLVADTDGDGLSDGVEVKAAEQYSDTYGSGDPLRKDVYIEVDYMSGTALPADEKQALREAFDTAPVQNPDGTQGITLHVVEGNEALSAQEEISFSEYQDNQYQRDFENRDRGFYHVFIVEKIEGSRTIGLTTTRTNGMLAQYQTEDGRVGSTIMHELGHNFGLLPNVFNGIDSQTYSSAEYPSLMNYNGVFSCSSCSDIYVYSDGSAGSTDHNDWAYIEQNLETNAPPSSELRGDIPPAQPVERASQ